MKTCASTRLSESVTSARIARTFSNPRIRNAPWFVRALDVDIQLPRPSRDRLGPSECGVEFFDRAAPGLDPDHQVGSEREHVPDREIVEAGDDAGERSLWADAMGQHRIVRLIATAAAETASRRRAHGIAVQPFHRAAGKGDVSQLVRAAARRRTRRCPPARRIRLASPGRPRRSSVTISAL